MAPFTRIGFWKCFFFTVAFTIIWKGYSFLWLHHPPTHTQATWIFSFKILPYLKFSLPFCTWQFGALMTDVHVLTKFLTGSTSPDMHFFTFRQSEKSLAKCSNAYKWRVYVIWRGWNEDDSLAVEPQPESHNIFFMTTPVQQRQQMQKRQVTAAEWYSAKMVESEALCDQYCTNSVL